MKTDDTTPKSPPRGRLGRMVSRVVSDGSLTKKASLNAAASTAEQGARIVAGLIISPILLTRLGDTAFGIWQVLQRLIGHASPASGRPGEALKWTIAHEQRSTDYDFKRRQVGNALAVWLLFLPLLLAIGGVLAWLSPVWLDVPRASFGTVRVAAGILVLDAVLFSLLYLPQSVLQGENLGYKRLGLSVLLVFVSKSLLVVAVYFGMGIGGLAVATAVATVLWGVTYLFIVRSRVAWFGIARPSLAEVRHFVGLSWWFLLWNLVMVDHARERRGRPRRRRFPRARHDVHAGEVPPASDHRRGGDAHRRDHARARRDDRRGRADARRSHPQGDDEPDLALHDRRGDDGPAVGGVVPPALGRRAVSRWTRLLLPGVRRRPGDHADGAPVRVDPHGRQHHRSDAEPPEEGAPRNDLRRGVDRSRMALRRPDGHWASSGSSSDSSWAERSRASATHG